MATALRDYGTTNKLNVDYDELTKKVTLGNKTLAPEQLKALGGQLVNNSWQFDDVSKLNTLTGVKPPEPTPPVQTPTTPTTPDYSSQISGMFNAERDMLLNQLKQKIAESKAQQDGIIKNAPKQFDPLRAQSELSKGQQLRSVLERNALMGDRGGIGRSAALQTQTAGENRLNAINLQQQDVIDTANQRIADLESQGRFEEADIIQRQKLAELQALMKESQRQDELRRGEMATAETQSRSDFNNTIMANYNDLMGFANQLKNQGAPQWQIDAVLAARQQKIAEQGLDQQGRPIPVDNTAAINEMKWNRAMDKWNSGIPLTQEEMTIIGSPYPVKPKAPTSTGGGTTVNQNRDFAFDLWKALGTANQTVADIIGVPVGTPFGTGGGKPADFSNYQDYINDFFVRKDEITGAQSIDRGRLIPYLIQLEKSGQSDAAVYFADFYGISEEEIENIERVMGGSTKR